MKETKSKFMTWVKKHSKELLLSGISITVIIGVIIGIKNKDAIMNYWNNLENMITKTSARLPESMNVTHEPLHVVEDVRSIRAYTSPSAPFNVSRHIRNLAKGRLHSPKKAAEADALGIHLLPNQTLVNEYTKCVA